LLAEHLVALVPASRWDWALVRHDHDSENKMKIAGRKIWQVAAGLKERNYVDALIEWDVAIIGPGEYGTWPSCTGDLQKYVPGMVPVIKRFCEEMKRHDLLVLRLGTDQIYAVGEVVDEKPQWFDDFGDVDGWDLQIVRRVRYFWSYGSSPKTFPPRTLKFGPTILSLDSEPVIEWLKELEVPQDAWTRELKPLPCFCEEGKPRQELTPREIGECLYDRGISSDSISALLTSIDELSRIAGWYSRAELEVSEQETITYLTVPLLKCLGWSPQKMAVQREYVDIALFDKLPRENTNLSIVVEAKKFKDPIKVAFSQAASYAEQEGRENCRRLILTDGIKYYVYTREKGGRFSDRPRAYLNLTRLVEDYPLLHLAGAKDALTIMAADWSDYEPSAVVQLEES
jgi:hypothetical protein